jgi:hypothetical protein
MVVAVLTTSAMMLRNTLRYELELQNDDIRDDEGVLDSSLLKERLGNSSEH